MKVGRIFKSGNSVIDQNFDIIKKEFEDLEGEEIEQTFSIAGQSYTVAHNLRKVPRGWQVIDKDTYGSFLKVSATATGIILKCDTTNTTATLLVW